MDIYLQKQGVLVFFCQAGIAAKFLVTRYTFWKNTPIAAFQILDKDLKTRTLELAQVDKEYYFDHTLSEGLRLIRRDKDLTPQRRKKR